MARQGKTIIELLVVISVFGAMMTPIGRLLHTMMRAEREGAHALAAGTNASRLAREFRSDVHAARDTQLAKANGELQLVRNDGTVVTYRAAGDHIQRTITRGEETLSRDSFRLGLGATRFELSDEPPLAILLHERRSPGANPPESPGIRSLRVEAVPGRDYRFEN